LVGARAYTVGRNIVFGDTQSSANRPLLAHELTHVAQQTINAGAQLLRRQPLAAIGHGGGPSLHGDTKGTFDGGKKKIDGLKISRATGCDCPAGQQCMNAVGNLVVTYKVGVTIKMPPMPRGLSKCKQNRVAAFFKNELRPHEEDHKRRFETYNGTTQRPIEARGCGKDGAKSALDTKAQEMLDDESAKREDAARKKSADIDPFVRVVDFEGCDEPTSPSVPRKR
jgi:hypothetical protein